MGCFNSKSKEPVEQVQPSSEEETAAQATREADTMQERLEGQAKKGDSTANDLISGGGTGNGTSDVRSINQAEAEAMAASNANKATVEGLAGEMKSSV